MKVSLRSGKQPKKLGLHPRTLFKNTSAPVTAYPAPHSPIFLVLALVHLSAPAPPAPAPSPVAWFHDN